MKVAHQDEEVQGTIKVEKYKNRKHSKNSGLLKYSFWFHRAIHGNFKRFTLNSSVCSLFALLSCNDLCYCRIGLFTNLFAIIGPYLFVIQNFIIASKPTQRFQRAQFCPRFCFIFSTMPRVISSKLPGSVMWIPFTTTSCWFYCTMLQDNPKWNVLQCGMCVFLLTRLVHIYILLLLYHIVVLFLTFRMKRDPNCPDELFSGFRFGGRVAFKQDQCRCDVFRKIWSMVRWLT